jgi:hypothetical protein
VRPSTRYARQNSDIACKGIHPAEMAISLSYAATSCPGHDGLDHCRPRLRK